MVHSNKLAEGNLASLQSLSLGVVKGVNFFCLWRQKWKKTKTNEMIAAGSSKESHRAKNKLQRVALFLLFKARYPKPVSIVRMVFLSLW